MQNQSTNQQPKAPEYVTTIREGAIGASIFLNERKDGSQNHYFKISRAYKPNGQEDFKYSDQFFPKYGEAIAKVASEAAAKCAELDGNLKQ